MQKLATALTLLLLSVGFSHAQDVEVGLRGGTNYSAFKGDTDVVGQRDISSPFVNQGDISGEFSRVFGVRVGGFLRFGISKSFSVRGEVTYSQKGGKLNFTQEQIINETLVRVNNNLNFRYNYLDIPILAEYGFEIYNRFQAHVFTGPSIAFALTSNLDPETKTKSINQFGQEQDINLIVEKNFEEPDIESADVGAVIGGGISYLLKSKNSVFLDVRYNPSFTAFNSGSIADAEQNIELENETITVGVGYSFFL
ncbi:porin family protein [Salinibacter ruber]|uniref:porin family protein n=1 Tax=Salinibacter ruber TaxID=146919 RepID=UPI000E56AD0C|nr:porin family protein [Salinibacter ruber]